ncbi:MAG: PKD domain-containing protein [Bacteroidota bacterium]
MKLRLTLLVFLLAIAGAVHAQYNTMQNRVWAFGILAGLNFNTGVPVPFTYGMQSNEGCASVCDEAGNLLFATQGYTVYNRLGAIMPAGLGIVPFMTLSTTQGALIVPMPGSTTLYYVFSIEWTAGNIAAPPIGKFVYAIVDMSLAGGMGDVAVAGTPISANLSEKMIAIRGDDCNVWVLVHSKDSAVFRAYEITPAGLSLTPVVSVVGSFTGTNSYAAGVIKVSHDRTRIVSQCQRSVAGGPNGTELYDFNPATGIVSNCRVLNTNERQYGAEFSPDNTKLYTSQSTLPAAGVTTISQYNIALPSTAAIIASRVILNTVPATTYDESDMKLAADGKIYCISNTMPPALNTFFDIINAPNNAGAACGFVPLALSIAPNWNVYGLPNTVWTVLHDTSYARHDTSGCFTAGVGTIASSVAGTGYLWYDGVTTATHSITGPGTYCVAVHNACHVTIDTIVVHAATTTPPPVISGITTYCYGAPFVPFTAVGTGILWYTSTAGPGSAVPPVVNTLAPGTYTFYATQTISCVSPMASITVTVLPKIELAFAPSIRAGCGKDTVDFTNLVTGADHYTWNFGDGSPLDTNRLSATHVYSVPGVYSVTLTGWVGGCEWDTTLKISTARTLQADFTADTVCLGNPTTVTNLSVPAGAITSAHWYWGDGMDGAGISPAPYLYPRGGIYPALLVVTDTLGCLDSVTKSVYVLSLSIDMVHDTTLCLSGPMALENTVRLDPWVPATVIYNWDPADKLDDATKQVPYFNGLGVTTYTLTVVLYPYTCIAVDTIRINSVAGDPLTNVTKDVTIPLGSSVQLFAGNEVLYMWQPNDGSLTDANINNPVAAPQQTTRYTVYGYDRFGCIDSAFVTVFVDSSVTACIPSAFTPDGDGLNDIFRPLCVDHRRLVAMQVYNRWGERVFYSDNIAKGWDGTYKGVPQNAGTYYYYIILSRPGDGASDDTFKGDVTLIR